MGPSTGCLALYKGSADWKEIAFGWDSNKMLPSERKENVSTTNTSKAKSHSTDIICLLLRLLCLISQASAKASLSAHNEAFATQRNGSWIVSFLLPKTPSEENQGRTLPIPTAPQQMVLANMTGVEWMLTPQSSDRILHPRLACAFSSSDQSEWPHWADPRANSEPTTYWPSAWKMT